MILSALFLLALASGGDASVLARRVEQSLERRQASQGGYALSNPVSCPANYSTPCGSKGDVNQLCCPQGNTCFGSNVGYCCPTTQDCDSYVTTFGSCIDPTANMYESADGYFCCAQGLTGVIPSSGYPFCESSGISVAVTLLATMVSQYGGTSVTPFGGFATTPPVTGAGGATPTAGSNTTPTGTTSSPKASETSGSDIFGSLSTGAFIAIIIGGIIVLSIALGIWRWCKARVRKTFDERDQSRSAGPSMMPAFIPTNVPIYEPAPLRRYENNMYDPVLERGSAVSPMSPPLTGPPRRSPAPMTPAPMTPSPAYSAFDQHEMAEGRGLYDPIEVHGVGSTTGRVEMA